MKLSIKWCLRANSKSDKKKGSCNDFWGEAILTATYLISLTPSKALKIDKTPYELCHGEKPQLKYLKVLVLLLMFIIKIDTKNFKKIPGKVF